MVIVSGILVVVFALFLAGLATLIFVKPVAAEEFLRLFASSARAHYTEQILRLLAGSAIVVFSSSMWFSPLFQVFGWIIVVSAIGLLFMPWQWHHRFGKWAIPLAIRHMKLYAAGAIALAVLILLGVSRIAYT